MENSENDTLLYHSDVNSSDFCFDAIIDSPEAFLPDSQRNNNGRSTDFDLVRSSNTSPTFYLSEDYLNHTDQGNSGYFLILLCLKSLIFLKK